MTAKFAQDKCGQCGADLTRRRPKDIIEVRPHPGEEGIVEERLWAACPVCNVPALAVEEEPTEPSEPAEPETEPEPEAPEPETAAPVETSEPEAPEPEG